MARVSKSPEERKKDILDAAKELFQTKGYERTAVSDIVKKVGVAQGTIYYYFQSKSDIADALIDRELQENIASLQQIVDEQGAGAVDKLEKVRKLLAQGNNRMDEIEYLHEDHNAMLHQKALVRMIREYAPLVASIVEQGNREGVFHTDNPLVITEFLLAGSQFLFDPGIFSWTEEELRLKLAAVDEITEKLLGAKKGTFHFSL
ncbi:TetR/AcrR family transcriptional regulator [Paenibacillus sediminis]|uniref:AcrR family transcriptional regulator n=1 Tax=Paenibacillus sediminis TaxID=664909 RepID=A0ABS4H3U6_9BACL|nr:TetR/AcrR family transcriptional regulator [Paenibacillus sediminis]MBP1937205.1 AcrR family transcriptional regulator [Paenibacillus sediminis]